MNIPLYTCQLVRDRQPRSESLSVIESASEAAKILKAIIGDSDREHFVVLALDTRKQLIGAQIVSIGTTSASIVHPREVFKPAILLNAAGIIIGHNHPSGDKSPSSEDRDVTKRLQRAGEIIGIPVLDHVIIAFTPFGGYGDATFDLFSFREVGLL